MTTLEHIDNLEVAKQALLLLEKENERLHQRIRELVKENAALRGEDGKKQLEIELATLQERLAQMQRRLYGASSEKQPGPGKEGKEGKEGKTADKPRRGHGRRRQPALKREEKRHELDPGERTCGVCGNEDMKEWRNQFEESEEITVVERRFVLVTHKRQKYRCRCNSNVVTAPGPLKLRPKGRYSLEFAVEVAVDKYADNLPLDRQVRRMRREGLEVTSAVLWDYLSAMLPHLLPSYEAIGDYQFCRPYLHVDETPWRLLAGRPSKRWWLWGAASAKAVYFWLHPGRSVEAALDFLAGYRGKLIVDGYQVYQSLARNSRARLWLVNCWIHARRKFLEASKNDPRVCQPILSWIQKLYRLERHVSDPATMTGKERRRALKKRWKLRQRYARPLIKAIRTWALRQSALPGSASSKAITYLLKHWHGLTRFLDDPSLPLDNNFIERELRTPVIGRKNHYGSRSVRGTEVAAVFYTLIGTARLAGEEPKAYLLRALRAAIEQPGTVTLPRGLRS